MPRQQRPSPPGWEATATQHPLLRSWDAHADALYAVQLCDSKAIKVGRTVNLTARFRGLCKQHKQPLRVLFVIVGSGDAEGAVLDELRPFRLRGPGGSRRYEYHRPVPGMVAALDAVYRRLSVAP